MRYTSLLFFFLTLWNCTSYAQETGKKEYPNLGLSFSIPEGWFGQESEEAYVISSNNRTGIVLMIPHSEKLTIQQMKTEVQSYGLVFDNFNVLKPVNELDIIDANTLGGAFEGTLNYQQVKAYVIGIVNPHGNGLTIIATDNVESYDQSAFTTLALNVKNSVKFSKAIVNTTSASNPGASKGGSVADWKKQLSGTRLTYMNTYSSNYAGDGYSDETQIHLCKEGYFWYMHDNSMSIGSIDNATVYSSSRGNGNGTWDIVAQNNSSHLVLTFKDGSTKSYELSWDGDKLNLNGYRYFRTWEGEYAPDCN